MLILVLQYPKGDDAAKKQIYDFYLANTRQINGWDLVDCSAPHIVGAHLFERIAVWALGEAAISWGPVNDGFKRIAVRFGPDDIKSRRVLVGVVQHNFLGDPERRLLNLLR